MAIARIVGVALTAIVGLSIFGGAFYQVDQGELGVVLRNGRVNQVAPAGLHFKLPMFDSVVKMSTRTHKSHYAKVSAYSRDQQTADLVVTINWRYDPSRVSEVYATYGEIGFEDRILTPRVMEQAKTVFGQFNAVTAIQERGRLNIETEGAISKAIENTGGVVESVQIENIDFSRAYEQSIEERMQAEVAVQKLKQQLEQERVKADSVRVQAQAQADAKLAQAKADADATKLRGDAEAASIDARGKALRDNPELVKLIQAEKWNGVLPTHMVPNGAVPFVKVD